MKNKSKKNTNIKAGSQPKYDSIDIIFRVQRMMVTDTERFLERYYESLGIPAPGKIEFPSASSCENLSKTVNMAYKFRLVPDDGQRKFLAKHIGCALFVYNHYLMQRKQYYKDKHISLSYNAQSADLTKLKKQDGYEWLKDVNAQSLQQSLRNLDQAFKNFFDKRAAYPKPHSKIRKNTFTVPQSARIEGGLLWLPKFKSGIPIILHRKMEGKIGMVTISRTPTGDYYASFCVEVERGELAPNGKAVGLDLGIKSFAVTSDGKEYENPKYFKKYERKLARAQKCLARKYKDGEKESKGYKKQRLKVAKIHEKIQNCRKDYLHKRALELVKEYEIICIEDLNVRGMIRNPKLAKAIADASWGTFVTILKYKAHWYGRKVVQVDRFFPSSQTCHNCGYINKETKDLKIRKWVCPKCGELHDRDLNASLNIRDRGLKMLSERTEN